MVRLGGKLTEETVTRQEIRNPKGWICISKSHDQIVRAGDGYLESLGLSYEWRKALPNGTEMATNDVIVIRDAERILGISRIEDVKKKLKLHTSNRCPKCDAAQVRERKTLSPKYKCARCGIVFSKVVTHSEKEEFRIATYAPGWVALDESPLTLKGWRRISKTPKSQHSIQEIDLDKFEEFRSQVDPSALVPFNCRDPLLNGGHRLGIAKTRVGQAEFRRKLFSYYANNCAITGPNHQNALEAAHLYSFSEIGVHHNDGGLLLRRDIHRLFDTGLIAINPDTLRIDISQELLEIESYSKLNNEFLKVELNQGQKKWCSIHWKEYRR